MKKGITAKDWGVSRINPEKLWMHYSFALVVIIGLLATIFYVSEAMVRQSAFMSTTLEASSGQTLLSQEILLLATDTIGRANADFSQLAEVTRNFETTHLVLLQGDLWSDQLQRHYFGGTHPLNAQIREFADLTNRLSVYPLEQRPVVIARLHELHGPMGLFESLQTAVWLFDDIAATETAGLQDLLRKVLVFSGIVLLAEALLIFLPAQVKVKSVIKELRQKTNVLSEARNKQHQLNNELQHMLHHDALTGLPNRGFMTAHLDRFAGQERAIEIGIVFVGLDNFKTINDTISYETGDQLLVALAKRLLLCVDEDDKLARIGGDEFLLTTNEASESIAKRILASCAEPFSIDGRSINLSCSIGYLTTKVGLHDPDQILGNAALALQAAKIEGGNRAVAFSDALREQVASIRQLQMELYDAIKLGQIEPWFQPQISLSDGRLHGAEVLARWRHPTRGLLTPDKFFPAAERAGMTIDLDHAIWRAALECASKWQTDGIWRPKISVNAAPDTIADPHLIERLLRKMHQFGLDTDQVIVELLETTIIEGSEDMAAIKIDGLAECGIMLELDDFGTGYASLSKLTQLPLAGIKLDRTLVAPLPDTGADSVIRAILALAAELGLKVVAEGIEECHQADHLNACGCPVGQGYGFARPMPIAEFDAWLRENAHTSIIASDAAA